MALLWELTWPHLPLKLVGEVGKNSFWSKNLNNFEKTRQLLYYKEDVHEKIGIFINSSIFYSMPLNPHVRTDALLSWSNHSGVLCCLTWGVSAVILPHEAVQQRKRTALFDGRRTNRVVRPQVRRGGNCCVMYKILVCSWSWAFIIYIISHSFC